MLWKKKNKNFKNILNRFKMEKKTLNKYQEKH